MAQFVVFSDPKRCRVLCNLGHLMTFACAVQATSLRREARVVNHSSAARVMDDMENKLDEKYLVARERW